MISAGAARARRWSQQQLDRSVPLGELLVRDGRRLARGPADRAGAQDGLSAGRPRRLPGRARSACASSAIASPRACSVLPLLLRDGRLVVALDDPSQPRRASTRSSSAPQMKVVPVLARCTLARRRVCTPPTRRSAPTRRHRRPATCRRRGPIELRLATTPTSWSSRSRRKDASARSRRRRADRAVRQLAGAPDQQHDHRGAQRGRLRHPHRELSRAARRSASASARTALLRTYLELPHELPQRAGRAHQDHVRPRHLRAPQAAGRQDQLREVRAAARASSCASRPSRPTTASKTW